MKLNDSFPLLNLGGFIPRQVEINKSLWLVNYTLVEKKIYDLTLCSS